MGKKNLNPEGLINELKGGSSFFPAQTEPIKQGETHTPPTEQDKHIHDTVIPRYHEPITPTTHDTMIPDNEDELLEAVRKAVKQIGKEGATQRLTLEEKQALADIEYRYQRQGIRTSGNEIIRIALNYAVENYRKNGENSLLAKVLKRLNS
jgi:hypothetical protein